MKRNINEIYELLKQKIENCVNQIEGLHLEIGGGCSGKKIIIEKTFAVINQLMAYEDIEILLETSGVLEKPLNRETVEQTFSNDEFTKYRDKMFEFFNCNDHVILPSGEVVVFIKKRKEEYYRSKGEKYDDSKRNEEEKERS